MTAVIAWRHHIDELADVVCRLRRRHSHPASSERALADRAAASVATLATLDSLVGQAASELVGAGYSIEEALAKVDARADELNRQMRP